MSPTLALLLWFLGLTCLLFSDPALTRKTSTALWLPVIWLFILGTRLPSQWLGGQVGQAAQALEEGNPIDRTISSCLILIALGILTYRHFNWQRVLDQNKALAVFLLFALVSVCWSDYPFVAFKRWIRDAGNYLIVFIILSDRDPVDAFRVVFRRLFYIFIPLSIVLVKYYPEISRQYDYWTGAFSDVGPTTSKNMLGVACLLSGLFFFWDTVTRWSDRKKTKVRQVILLNLAFIGMTLWVLHYSNSTTSFVCLALGCCTVVAGHIKIFRRHPTILKLLMPAAFLSYIILSFGLGMGGELAGAVGKDPTLTDRTKIWSFLLSMPIDRLLGTGYESFWMGSRLQWFWLRAGLGRINEAHNGYLEVYLNLGTIGLVCLWGFLIASYRKLCKGIKSASAGFTSFGMALWGIALLYNVTEAGFRSGLMWFGVVLIGVTVPGRPKGEVLGKPQSGGVFGAGMGSAIVASAVNR